MSSASIDLGGMAGGTPGAVTSVTATSPLASTGGTTPNISITVPVTGTANHLVQFDGSGHLASIPPWQIRSNALYDYGLLSQQQPVATPDAGSPLTYGINSVRASLSLFDNVVNNKPYLWDTGIAFDEAQSGFNIGEFGSFRITTEFDGGGTVGLLNGIYLINNLPGDNIAGTISDSYLLNLNANLTQVTAATALTGIKVSQSWDSTNTVGTATDIWIDGTQNKAATQHTSVNVTTTFDFDAFDLDASAFADRRTFNGSYTTDLEFSALLSFNDSRVFGASSDVTFLNSLNISPTLNGTSSGCDVTLAFVGHIAAAAERTFTGMIIYYSGSAILGPLISPPVGLSLNSCSLQVSAVYNYALYGSSSLTSVNSITAELFAPSVQITGETNGLYLRLFSGNFTTCLGATAPLNTFSADCFLSLPGHTFSEVNIIKASIFVEGTGTVTDFSLFQAVGSGVGSATVTNSYLFRGTAEVTATNSWGLYIDSTVADNYLGKSLAIATSSKKVSNSSVGFEMGSTTQALRFPVLTTTQKNALTPLNGMEVFDSSLQSLCFYNGSSWITTGTVGIVSVSSANGFAGTVSSGTTSPLISITTTVNAPVLSGNGTSLSGASTTGSGATVVLSTSPTFVTSALSPAFVSTSSNAASAGIVRLSSSDSIQWRNAANSGNNLLATSSDLLTYSSQPVRTGNLVCRLIGSTSTVSSSQSLIKFSTSSEDSLSVYSAATGIITIPAGYAGNYLVYCQLIFAGTFALNTVCTMGIVKNGTAIGGSQVNSGGAVTTQKLDFMDIIQCAASDTLNMQATSTATGPSISNGTTYQNRWCVRYLGPL